jgi:hypothetical protein
MKASSYYVMIVIYPIILIVFNHHLTKYPKEIGNVNGKEQNLKKKERAFSNIFIRCVRCLKCGSTSPGIDCQWENNYTECGQCYSLNTCPLCLRKYRLDELIIQCTNCNRWCHSMCANIFTEEMAEKKCHEQTFLCLLCKPDQSTLTLMRYLSTNSVNDQQILQTKSVKYDEGVYLTENGLAHLKSIRPKTLTHPTRKSKQSMQKMNHEDERSDEEKIKKPSIKKYTGKNRTIDHEKLHFCALGIGGFVVKIRGNRRRQDLLHMDSELLRTKNKRLRKTILEEHMPPEMQVNSNYLSF